MKWKELLKELNEWSMDALDGDVFISSEGDEKMKRAIWTGHVADTSPVQCFLMVEDDPQPISKRFRVVTISSNTNSFGLHNHIFVAPDGDAWQAAAYRGPGGKTIKAGEILVVPWKNKEPCFADLGYEIAEPVPAGRASAKVVREIWGKEAEV
jgi:hypothetical protein